MPFVRRNSAGEIIAVSQSTEEQFSEELDKNDPDLRGFMLSISKEQTAMTESDLNFVRVVEDLVELLVAKNYIRFTDLPEKAQEKMRTRQTLRGKMNTHLDLLSDEEDGFF